LIIKTYGSDTNGLIVSITQYLKYIVIFEAGMTPVIKSILYKPILNNKNNIIKNILKTCDNFYKKVAYILIGYILILCLILPNILKTSNDSIFTISLTILISLSLFLDYFLGITYNIYLQVKQKVYVVSNIQIITILFNFIVCIIMIYFNVNIIIIKLCSTLILIMRPLLLKRYVESKYRLYFNNEPGNYEIEQKWNGFANHASYVVHNNTDVIILSIFSNINEISVYSIYYLIINSVRLLVLSVVGGVDTYLGKLLAKNDNKVLNDSFKKYELIYHSIAVVAFGVLYTIIIPFMNIYMKEITDVNYIRPIFASVMVLALFIWVIRQPYKDIIDSAGHFKQTQKYSIAEAILNILISLILVTKYGIVGVALGTLISITIRTVQLMIYVTKNILYRSFSIIIKRMILLILEYSFIILLFKYLIIFNITNYLNCVIYAIIISLVSLVIVFVFNYIFYNKDIKELFNKNKKHI